MGSLDGAAVIAGTVLVVEDNEVNQMIARQTIQSLGLDVVEASNGQEAISALESLDVDVVLMDCQMPVMDGYTATREIRRREAETESRRVPILALTADAFDDDAIRARDSGMDGHLAKPYTRTSLGICSSAGSNRKRRETQASVVHSVMPVRSSPHARSSSMRLISSTAPSPAPPAFRAWARARRSMRRRSRSVNFSAVSAQ